MSENIFERLRDAAPDAFAGNDVQFAYLFGSAARGEARPQVATSTTSRPSVERSQDV